MYISYIQVNNNITKTYPSCICQVKKKTRSLYSELFCRAHILVQCRTQVWHKGVFMYEIHAKREQQLYGRAFSNRPTSNGLTYMQVGTLTYMNKMQFLSETKISRQSLFLFRCTFSFSSSSNQMCRYRLLCLNFVLLYLGTSGNVYVHVCNMYEMLHIYVQLFCSYYSSSYSE